MGVALTPLQLPLLLKFENFGAQQCALYALFTHFIVCISAIMDDYAHLRTIISHPGTCTYSTTKLIQVHVQPNSYRYNQTHTGTCTKLIYIRYYLLRIILGERHQSCYMKHHFQVLVVCKN